MENKEKKTYRCLVNRHVMEAVPGTEFIIIPGWPDSQAVPVEEATQDQLEKYEVHKAVPLLQPVAILSTTVLPLDGTYEVVTIDPKRVDITGVPHYIGHPATKNIVEKMGAVQAESKLFPGLEPGEVAVCFSIAQGKSTRAKDGFTSPHQDVGKADLTCRVIRRLYVWEDCYGISVTTHTGGRYIEVEA
jgi:hypothetical protein